MNYISSPRTGIQRRLKWPPTISEVIQACEEQRDYLDKLRKIRRPLAERAPVVPLRERPDGAGANIFVPEGHPRYASLVKWTEDADPFWWKFGKSSDERPGLWVSLDAWEGRRA